MAGVKLKASTLVESLVAMVIFSVIFSVALGIYLKTTQSSITSQIVQARAMLREIAAATKKEERLFDEVIENNGITVTKKLIIHPDSENLLILELEAENPGKKKLGVWKEIISVE